MSEEYTKRDSDDEYVYHNARLTADAEVREYDGRKLVKLKFASDTRGKTKEGEDRYETLWVEALVRDYDAEKAAFLKKGDILTVRGKPGLRRWGDDGEKVSFDLNRAEIKVPGPLFGELMERGFTPGAGNTNSKAKPAGKAPAKKPTSRRPIVSIPDEDE